MPKTLYLISGPMGVGKTTACRELNRLLPASVMLDGDWCWQAEPFVVTPETKLMVLDNICHVLTNFLLCSAYENVVFCWVMHEQEIIDAILAQLPVEQCGTTVRAVSLVASEDALAQRIRADVSAGLRDEGAESRALAYLPRYRTLNTRLIDTTGLSSSEVAALIAHNH